MTKEQKILLVFVLAIATSSATFYVMQEKKDQVAVVNSAALVEEKGIETTPLATEQPVVAAGEKKVVAVETQGTQSIKQNVTYQVPQNHSDEIIVTLTINASGVITDASFAYNTPSNRESEEYLGKFSRSFTKDLVVGKAVSSVNLSRVGGASLTTAAFNKAVKLIGEKVSNS